MYITVPLSARQPQMSIDALFDFEKSYDNFNNTAFYDPSATYTAEREKIPRTVYDHWRPESFVWHLRTFVSRHNSVIGLNDYCQLYRHYEIPKKNGKMRPIDEPCQELKEAQNELLSIIKGCMPAYHHASAYAYIEQRACIDAAKKHQKNESNWYAKFDFTNFFGNTTPDFVMKMLKQIYPFSWAWDNGEWETVEKALSVCFLRGGLPQGASTSPMLTNIVMIPIDHFLCNTLHNYKKKSFVYTRYADDMQISCKYDFSVNDIESLILDALRKFDAPFTLNREKTHYGSRAGRNAMLGLHINAENQITVGHENKRFMKAMLTNYILDRKSKNRKWGLDEVQQLHGKLNYFRQIEKEYFNSVVQNLNQKFRIDIDFAMNEDIRNMTKGY